MLNLLLRHTQFQKNKLRLDKEAIVETRNEPINSWWLITDGNQTYIVIKKTENDLSVYNGVEKSHEAIFIALKGGLHGVYSVVLNHF